MEDNYRKQWSEGDRLEVIQAVMKVEDEIMKESEIMKELSGKPLRLLKGGALGKWERVNNRLPPQLRERKRKGKGYKIQSLFGGLLSEYRAMQTRKRGPCRYILTEAVCDILKKREAMWNAWTSGIRRSRTVETSIDSASYQTQLSATSNSSLSGGSDQVGTSEGWFMQTSSKQPAPLFSNHTGERGRNRQALHFSSNTDEVKKDDSTGSSLGREPRSSSTYHRLGSPTRCSLQSTWNSVSAEGSAQEVGKASGRPGVQARAENRARRRHWSSWTRSPSNSPQVSSRLRSGLRRRPTSVTHPSSPEQLPAIMDGPQRTIDLEFSRLRSWLQNALIPAGRKDLNDSLKSVAAIKRPTKRNRSSIRMATESSDNLIYGDLSRKVDLRIQASFQRLRTRFGKELKNISVKMAQDVADVVQKDSHSECSDPEFGQGVMWGPRPIARRSTTPHMRCYWQETMRKRPYSRR